MRYIPILIATIAAPASLFAAEPVKQEKDYSLTNPTPREQMREMSTDRPATTVTPYTVDAGHYQIEWEALGLGRDKTGNAGATTRVINSTVNGRIGLCNRSEVQVEFEFYRSVRTTGTRDYDESGIGDVDVRYKYNIWGGDGGSTSAAVMPFITLPTHSSKFNSNRDVEGGLVLPFSAEIEAGWRLGLMLEVDYVRNVADDGYALTWIQSIMASHQIVADLDGLIEVVNIAKADENEPSQGYFGVGATYAINPDLQLDAGINIGLTKASEDMRAFVGISFRK